MDYSCACQKANTQCGMVCCVLQYRVHYIFNSSLNVRLRKVSDTYLAAVVGVMVLVDIM